MSDVVIINVHGGFPSSMIARSFAELKGFRRLAEIADVHDRVYPTNACAGPALHDTIVDAPISTMTDSVWHEWSATRKASRTLFHMFQQQAMRTRLFGAFGLDARLDPHSHMHVDVSQLESALSMYGIDECDSQDAAFTCQLAIAHDADILRRVVEHLSDDARDGSREALMINLLGCQDAHKCTFNDVDPYKTAIPIMSMPTSQQQGSAPREVFDDRVFATNVVDDNPRNAGTQAHRREALRRAAQLKDWIRGEATGADRQDIVRAVTGLHQFCWKCVQQIDEGLDRILDALDATGRLDEAVVYVYSDHPIGLYEHGELCEAPWEACLRTFLLRKRPASFGSSPRVDSAPLSMAALPTMILEDASVHAGCWHVRAPTLEQPACVTVGLAMSWLARASMAPCVSVFELRTFFVRALVVRNGRPYAITLWFSLMDMARASGLSIPLNADEAELSRFFERHERFANPLVQHSLSELEERGMGSVSAYEHTSDPDEMDDLMLHRDWPLGQAAKAIKERIDASLADQGLGSFLLRVPANIHALTPDRVTFCSVQLHHRVRDRLRPLDSKNAPPIRRLRDAATQTETPPNLQEALGEVCSRDAAKVIATKLRAVPEQVTSLTVLVPDDEGGREWPSWVPPPLKGALDPADLAQRARERRFLVDAIDGASYPLTESTSDAIFLEKCKVILNSAKSVPYGPLLTGRIVVYRACRLTPTEPLAEKPEAAPAPSAAAQTLTTATLQAMDASSVAATEDAESVSFWVAGSSTEGGGAGAADASRAVRRVPSFSNRSRQSLSSSASSRATSTSRATAPQRPGEGVAQRGQVKAMEMRNNAHRR